MDQMQPFGTFSRLEECLYPSPDVIRWDKSVLVAQQYSTVDKVTYYVKNFFTFNALLLLSPLTLTYDWLTRKEVSPLRPDIAPAAAPWPPEQRGYATSLFQTSGLGTKWSATPGLAGKCDWDKWIDKPGHVIHPEGFDYRNFFVDILSDPTMYIAMLKNQNCTAHRFSLEWSVLQQEPDGQFDRNAVALYRNFIGKLIEAGITPSVTLCHFVLPEWFHESGGFQKMENIDPYVNFALKAMDCFSEVKDWWSFNELGVRAFQQTREVYPTDLPEGSPLSERVHAAGISTRNTVIAHCKLHQAVAERHPDKKMGVTHQWLKFDTAEGNWLENLVAHIFTKFGFTPVYQFFKEGRFAFQFPFMANIQFEVPREEFEANRHFLMRLGVQAYPQAMLKMGLNHGEIFPGLASSINNLPFFSFGATCKPGEAVMRFGPRWNAQRMDDILDEAFALSDQVFITEYGSDANIWKYGESGFKVDLQAQADYLRLLTERIRGRPIKGIFNWSDLTRQMEWENGDECQLATIDPVLGSDRRMVAWTGTFASEYIRDVYGADHPQEIAN